MHKKETNNDSQLSFFEIKKIIKEELGAMWSQFDPDEFEDEAKRAARQDIGDDFEELGSSRFEKGMDPEEFVGDINRAQMELPSEEEELERIRQMMEKKKKEEELFGRGGMNETDSMFQVTDSEGNQIKLKALVSNLEGTKKGRVIGFGDDGQGNQTVRVSWAWPIDMKHTNPKEMGEMPEIPSNLIAQGLNENENLNTMNEEINEELNEEINEELNEEQVEEGAEEIEEARGLGKGVKNMGDRNVKMRDDHSAAPLTNINESVNNSIKQLLEGKVTKSTLKEFISEQAKEVAKKLKG